MENTTIMISKVKSKDIYNYEEEKFKSIKHNLNFFGTDLGTFEEIINSKQENQELKNKLNKIKEYLNDRINIHTHLIEQWKWEEENVKEYETEPSNRPYLISMNERILEKYKELLSIIEDNKNE